jgi:hypothetical protein
MTSPSSLSMGVNPINMFIIVVFPEPFEPRRHVISLECKSSLKFLTYGVLLPLKVLDIDFMLTRTASGGKRSGNRES